MSVITQKAIVSPAHIKHLTAYLNDERALDCDSNNIINKKRWAAEMEGTRQSYGHDTPSRAGAQNTSMLHQIIAFLPEECDMNGGKLSAQTCMQYARDYVLARYANQEAIWVLHREYCRRSGIARYAVHIAINRTDLVTGNRLDEGRGRRAVAARVKTIRGLDSRYGLAQLKPHERNSMIQDRADSTAQQKLRQKSVRLWTDSMREAINGILEDKGVCELQGFVAALADKGIIADFKRSKSNVTYSDEHGHRIRGARLGYGCDRQSIEDRLAKHKNPNPSHPTAASPQDVLSCKGYMERCEKAYKVWRQQVIDSHDYWASKTTKSDIEPFTPPKPTEPEKAALLALHGTEDEMSDKSPTYLLRLRSYAAIDFAAYHPPPPKKKGATAHAGAQEARGYSRPAYVPTRYGQSR
jgi:hypothetical protein